MIKNHSDDMSSSETRANILALYPEDSREAAVLLKQAVPLMVRHNIPPNPVHYALWYTYSKGQDPELIRHLDRVVRDFDGCPPEAATRLFRQYMPNRAPIWTELGVEALGLPAMRIEIRVTAIIPT